MSVYVCQCIGYDNDFTTKTYERIKFEYFDYPSDYSIFVRMEIGEDLFICCSEMIDFCYRAHIYIFFLIKVVEKLRILQFHVSLY